MTTGGRLTVSPQRVRLVDVAARAGVSRSTVSFVLSGRDMRISEPTRRRVLRAARELDYRPNLTARSLRTQLSRSIGLVADTVVSGAYGGEMIRGALTAALADKHRLLISETEHDPAVEADVVADLADHQVDGFIYASESHRLVEIDARLRSSRTVLLNCRDLAGTPAVVPAEEDAGRMAVEVLLAAGHRAGIHLVGETPSHRIAGQERLAGVTQALASAGTALASQVECHWWPEDAFEAVSRLLRSGSPRALICLNDRIAFGAYQALGEAGRRIPEDVSVISFDDYELATWLRPALTTLALPHFEMGTRAVEMLLDKDQPPPPLTRVAMTLRGRGSVSAPSRSPGADSGRDG